MECSFTLLGWNSYSCFSHFFWTSTRISFWEWKCKIQTPSHKKKSKSVHTSMSYTSRYIDVCVWGGVCMRPHAYLRGQSCPTLCNPMDYKLPGSSVHGILPYLSPGDLPNPGIKPTSPVVSYIAGRFFTTEPWRKPCTSRLRRLQHSFLLQAWDSGGSTSCMRWNRAPLEQCPFFHPVGDKSAGCIWPHDGPSILVPQVAKLLSVSPASSSPAKLTSSTGPI